VLLSTLESWLWSGALLPSASVDEVAAWVEELSDLYTVERAMLARRQGDQAHLGAKVLYFLCADAPKVGCVLDECARRDGRFASPRRVVDLGCGVGATSVGLLAWLAVRGRREPLEITLVDGEASVLRIAERVVSHAAELANLPLAVRTAVADLRSMALPESTDLVLCQTALNELLPARVAEPAHASATIDAVTRWTSAAPTILIEPALKATTRALQRLRDAILERGCARIVAPCPHQHRCPMLGRPGDWCHESRHFEPTPMVAAVQARTRRRDERLTYAFMAFAPGGDGASRLMKNSIRAADDATLKEGEPSAASARLAVFGEYGSAASPSFIRLGIYPLGIALATKRVLHQPASRAGSMPWRLVTDPLGSRGKTERLVCRGDGAMRMVRVLDKERSAANELLVEAPQGTLVVLEPEPPADRIGPDCLVREGPG
jgi:ribosomal protein RSM22 (predicted rRNA methylase)